MPSKVSVQSMARDLASKGWKFQNKGGAWVAINAAQEQIPGTWSSYGDAIRAVWRTMK